MFIPHGMFFRKRSAGQWADIFLPDGQVVGLSMISSPHEMAFTEFAVKKSKHPVVQYLHHGAKVVLAWQ